MKMSTLIRKKIKNQNAKTSRNNIDICCYIAKSVINLCHVRVLEIFYAMLFKIVLEVFQLVVFISATGLLF